MKFNYVLAILAILAILFFSQTKEHVGKSSKIKKIHGYEHLMSHPTKCFSCENQEFPSASYPTKCFSCEKQVEHLGPKFIYQTKPSKCFSCDRQIINMSEK